MDGMYKMMILGVWYSVAGLLIASSWVSKIEAQQPGQCYFPGGAWANDSRPCDPYAITTLCCPIGWTCFSNYACVVTDLSVVGSSFPLGTTIRGACTNPLWNNGFCGSFCLNDPISPPSANNGSLVSCENGNWCCAPSVADGSCDCSSGNGTFSIPEGVAQTIISVSGLQSTSTGFITSTSATTTATATTASKTTSTSTSKTTSASGTSRTSTKTTPTASATGNSTAVHTPVTQTTGFKAGISVGSVAFAGILGFGAFLLWRWRRSHGEPTRDFPTRPSSPAYTAATSEPYDSRPAAPTYTAYNPDINTNVDAYPAPRPDPYRFSSQSPTLRNPTRMENPNRIERPVSPEYDVEYNTNRGPSMATLPLPYEGT
ncbi:hypothetical protein EG329_008367 [Mollisiaceae sp. DMI_Dod_QoI]|nr:hypothetical protein EG329_008367 [Helotiales sp. DMI_Dod_QoI]